MCVVLLFLLKIVIRHWTQHARQDLKMLNAMKLINRKKRLQETRTQRQTACGPVDPKENVWKTGGDPKNGRGGKSQSFLWVFCWSDLDFVDGATTAFFWAVID